MSSKITKFVSYNAIKTYINDVIEMKSSKTAVDKLRSQIDSTIRKIIKDATTAAKKKKRKTISIAHMTEAIEKSIGKKHLSWQETADEIIEKNPTELGKISRAINDHISKGKK